MGILTGLFGEQISTAMGCSGGYDFQGLANFRMAHGQEPINWAKILSDQFRAISLTRPLTSYEKFLYNSALDGLHKSQLQEKQNSS